jgi:hypothetical protein
MVKLNIISNKGYHYLLNYLPYIAEEQDDPVTLSLIIALFSQFGDVDTLSHFLFFWVVA